MIAEKKWILAKGDDTGGKTQELASGLGIPPVLAGLLIQRGIDSTESAERFFNPLL